MEKPPREWIDKVFTCLSMFYVKRFTGKFDRWCTQDMAKSVWQSALTGLSYEQIRNALVYFRQKAQSPYNDPPDHLEFFHVAKTRPTVLSRRAEQDDAERRERASGHVQAILAQLHSKKIANKQAS